MKFKLQQKQTASLRMSPALRQAIQLLQYSTQDLYDYLKEQEAENPLIQLEEKRERPDSFLKPAGAAMQNLDFIADEVPDMRTGLVQQAQLTFTDSDRLQLVLSLIDLLDENGYLPEEIDEEEDRIRNGIELLQQIGPAGIGSRNLQECLLLQIEQLHPEQLLAKELISHLELVAARNWSELADVLDAPTEEVRLAADFIKTLQPKPAAMLDRFQAQYITPDIIVEMNDGVLSCHLNDGYLPAVHLNPEYSELKSEDTETANYLKEKFNSFEWLVRSLEQRRATMLKISECLLSKQRNFFSEGSIALKPLTLNDVAQAIDMHESTVSRAVANKFVQTPVATFELRQLFASKVENFGGEAVSQTRLKTLLRELILREDKRKPLSDQKIAQHFDSEHDIRIARRTIAKYRTQLRFPPAGKRKK